MTPRVVDGARRLLGGIDRKVARVGLAFERPGLASLLFHSLFADRAELHRNLVHPQEGLTVQALRECIEHLLEAEYVFASIADIESGLMPGRLHACITFDDGYANNLRALPLLEEYRIPAAVFVSTAAVADARRFWWDVLFVERTRRGVSPVAIEREIASLKGRDPASVANYVEREFGSQAAMPQSDLDRPLTVDELTTLSKSQFVTIGNHTKDHPLLTRLADEEVHEQLLAAQDYLGDVIGTRPRAVAYPNGDVDPRVVAIAADVGLAVGFTTSPRKERVPVEGTRRLALGRFRLSSTTDTTAELQVLRSGVQLVNGARRARSRLSRLRLSAARRDPTRLPRSDDRDHAPRG